MPVFDATNAVTLGVIFGLGAPELMIVGVIGVLLFGKRLPEVGRSLGKGLVEFKRGVSGIESELDTAVYNSPQSSYGTSGHGESSYAAADDYHETDVPKFEPPTSEPTTAATASASDDGEAKSDSPTTASA